MDLSQSSHRLGIVVALLAVAIIGASLYFNKEEQKSGAEENAPVTESSFVKNDNLNKAMPETITMPTGAIIKTNMGEIEVSLFVAEAPKTVENFTTLAKSGFYDNTKFHRVIKNFMIQGGDPFSKDDGQTARWGTGGPGYQFADEINSQKIVRGVLAMANAGPNTNGSQFFIVTTAATPWLDGKHTVFGKVVKGMDVVDKIENAPTGANDIPISSVVVESVVLK